MKVYKKLVKKILKEGELQNSRNGNCLIIPHAAFVIDFRETNPILPYRKMYTKGIEGEFKTLIDPTPLTNIAQFEANGCNYWKLWAKEDGSINIDYHNMMHPQLENIIEQIKKDPNSRRHHIELWNYKNLGSLSLENCWHGLTFTVINKTLHLKWTQRSVDTMIGLPSDIYLAYMFMDYVAKECNLEIGSCLFSLSNVHIYEEHIKSAKKLLKRTKKDSNKPLKFELKA